MWGGVRWRDVLHGGGSDEVVIIPRLLMSEYVYSSVHACKC